MNTHTLLYCHCVVFASTHRDSNDRHSAAVRFSLVMSAPSDPMPSDGGGAAPSAAAPGATGVAPPPVPATTTPAAAAATSAATPVAPPAATTPAAAGSAPAPAPAPVPAPTMPYLGSTIALITKSDMRYVGTLTNINPQKATVSLSNGASM